VLDPKLLREDPEKVKENLAKRKKPEYLELVDEYVTVDIEWREIDQQVNQLRQKRNTFAKKIGKAKGDDKQQMIAEMPTVNDDLEEKEEKLETLAERRQWILDRIPNLLHESVPYGEDDSENVPIRKWGETPEFDFEPKDHHQLMEELDLVELERARKTSGSRFYYLKNEAVILEMALLRYAMDILLEEDLTLFSTPTMVRERMLYGTGFLPVGEEDIYKIEGEDLGLIGTSEVTLAGLHADEVFIEDELPIRYAGFSNNYRTEASATTMDDKGIFRVHEFKKIEQFSFVHPDNSWEEQERLISIAERVFKGLGMP